MPKFIAVNVDLFNKVGDLLYEDKTSPKVVKLLKNAKTYETNPLRDSEACASMVWDGNLIIQLDRLC